MSTYTKYQITYTLPTSRRVYYVKSCLASVGGTYTLDKSERKVYDTREDAQVDLDIINVKTLTMAGSVIEPTEETNPSGYTYTELECKGCMGPCGQCEQPESEPTTNETHP